MSRSDVLLGQYGTIPDDVYLRKIERSGMPEDPMLVENYMRSQLADFRPDPVTLASDEARDPSDRGGGTHSKEFLALRYHGARTEEDPYLPDGTFLDFEFLERDPRGPTNEPNWNEDRRQRLARAPFIKFYNDDDYTVPETGIHPVVMRDLIRNSQQQFKDRFMNFTESFDGWAGPGVGVRSGGNPVDVVDTDGTIINLADASSRNRQDAVGMLSNAVRGIPRYTTPDHRVKIARYGQVRPMQYIGSNDWNTNRSNALLDHQIPVEINGEMVNKMLATLIVDLEGQRVNKQMVAQGANYGDSDVNMQHQQRQFINPEDIYKMLMISMGSRSQPDAPHVQYEGMAVHRSSRLHTDTDLRYMLNQGLINHEIAASMAQMNRNLSSEKRGDLRENIRRSAATDGFLVETKARRANKKSSDLKREGITAHSVEESKTTKNYAGSVVMTTDRPQTKILNEKFGGKSRGNQLRAKNYGHQHTTTEDTEFTGDMKEFRLPSRRMAADDTFVGRSVADSGDIAFGASDGKHDLDFHQTLMDMVLAD